MRNLLFALPVLMLFLSGCASSDRMFRTSGGVITEYSAPKSHRLRSENFQKGSAQFGKPRDQRDGLSGMRNIVNFWPFFFKSNDYFSVLWPMIDCDSYGWAVRPLYNQEGDDCSVLFPLSSYNKANHNGWMLNFVRDNKKFSFFPFSFHDFGKKNGSFFWYTPLVIRDTNSYVPNWRHRTTKKDNFTEVCLCWKKERVEMVPETPYSFLLSYRPNDDYARQKNYLNYHFSKLGITLPKDKKAMEALKDRLFRKHYRERMTSSYGFFPLFSTKYGETYTDFDLLFFLLNTHHSEKLFKTSFLGKLLGEYRNEKIGKQNWNYGGRSFTSWALLTFFERRDFYRNTELVRTFRELNKFSDLNTKSAQKLLKKIDPSLKVPKTVVDLETRREFLKELEEKQHFEVGHDLSAVFVPLFIWKKFDSGRNYWVSPALLSWYNSKPNQNRAYGCFLPLLSGFSKTPTSESLCIVPGPGAIVKTTRVTDEKRGNLEVFPHDQKWVSGKWNKKEYEDQYYFFGLFYRGKDQFYVAKKGVNPKDVQELKKQMREYFRTLGILQRMKKNTANRIKLNGERIIKTKIDRYYQLIEEEKIKIAQTDATRKENEIKMQFTKIRTLAAKMNFKLPDDLSKANEQDLKNRVQDQFAELRGHEDIGNGLFFRKENFYNGDHNWRLLGFVAGGEKTGSFEKTHVLHLLYRHSQQGDREETLCFPFIMNSRDGKDTHFSFMWRLFSLTKKNGKTGGHLFFIPF